MADGTPMPSSNSTPPSATGPLKKSGPPKPGPVGMRITGKTTQLEDRNAKALAQANPIYDRINMAWTKAEEHIQKLGVLAPVEMCYEEFREYSWYLGVQKRNGKWRICHGEYNLNEEVNFQGEGEYCTQWTAISDCNVELRIAMAKHLESVIEKVVETNEKTVAELEKSAETVELTLKKLGIL
jgi:hypothetical protein